MLYQHTLHHNYINFRVHAVKQREPTTVHSHEHIGSSLVNGIHYNYNLRIHSVKLKRSYYCEFLCIINKGLSNVPMSCTKKAEAGLGQQNNNGFPTASTRTNASCTYNTA